MPAKAAENVVTYGSASVKLYTRANGTVAISWSEKGSPGRTTRAKWAAAVEFANKKARELDAASGARWVTPASADRLAWLEKIAGGPEKTGRLLTHLEKAKEVLHGNLDELTAAAEWYVKFGPPAVHRRTLHEAVTGFIEELEAHHPSVTVRPIKATLKAFDRAHPGLDFLEVTHGMVDAHVRRATEKGPPQRRTIQNRISHFTQFFNRCEDLGWWPEGKKHPSAKIKRPRKIDKAPDIFTPEIGSAILQLVAAESIQHLPYLLIAGWLHCRPSECQRVDKADFDFKHGILHLRAEVVGKTGRERWVPIPKEVAGILKELFRLDDEGLLGGEDTGGTPGNPKRACRWRSREHISALAREHNIITRWPVDVLRHSSITYRLQEMASIDKTAEEAGNSPAEIRASYKRPIPPNTWKRWKAAPLSVADFSARASSRNRSSAQGS